MKKYAKISANLFFISLVASSALKLLYSSLFTTLSSIISIIIIILSLAGTSYVSKDNIASGFKIMVAAFVLYLLTNPLENSFLPAALLLVAYMNYKNQNEPSAVK